MKLFNLKSEQQVIDEIHAAFDTAQDRLLEQAKQIIQEASKVSYDNDDVAQIAARLDAIGFVNTPMSKKGFQVRKEAEEKTLKIVKSKEEAELIEGYKQRYPFLKFLTTDALNEICDKYGLIHAPVSAYIKDVPVQNLKDIERAQILFQSDREATVYRIVPSEYYDDTPKEIKQIFDKGVFTYYNYLPNVSELLEHFKKHYGYIGSYESNYGRLFKFGKLERQDRAGLFIAAPHNHFDLKGLSKKSKHGFFKVFTTEVNDPIVFRYVKGGIQVLTKWGLEANDPALVNSIDN